MLIDTEKQKNGRKNLLNAIAHARSAKPLNNVFSFLFVLQTSITVR